MEGDGGAPARLPLGVGWFSVAVTGLSVSTGAVVTVVGLPLMAAFFGVGRMIAAVERATARALLDIDPPPHPVIERGSGWWARCRRMLTDLPSWKGIADALVSLPVGIGTFTTAVVLWSVAAGATAFPVYQAFMSASDTADVPIAFSPVLDGWGRVGAVAGIGIFGLVMLALTPRILHRVANVQRTMVRRWLSGQ